MKIIDDFLSNLGFTKDEISIYTALSSCGPLTLLETARKTKIERTKLYRLIDELIEKGIIEEIPQYKRKTIRATSISTIEMLVKDQQIKSELLTKTFPTFLTALQTFQPNISKNNVVYYHGQEGLRQMAWHILRTKGLYYTYSYRFWDEILGEKFTVSLNEEMVSRNMKVHDIYSDQYFEYKAQWLKKHGHKPKGDWSFWRSRFISEKILKVDQNIDIYNDVVAYYHWEGNETFGVEIYNERVATFHKQMHNIVWKMAKPVGHFDWTKEWE